MNLISPSLSHSLPPPFIPSSLPLIICPCFLLLEPAKVRKPGMATNVASWGHTPNAAGCRTELERWAAGNMLTWSPQSSYLQGFSSNKGGRGRGKDGQLSQGQARTALLLMLTTRSSWHSCAFFPSLPLLSTFLVDAASPPSLWQDGGLNMLLLHFS